MNLLNILAVATTVMGSAMSLSYFIQIAKVLKTKSAKDLSLIMFTVFSTGMTLWLIYGLVIQNIPLIIANVIGVIGAYSLLGLILKFR